MLRPRRAGGGTCLPAALEEVGVSRSEVDGVHRSHFLSLKSNFTWGGVWAVGAAAK
ncbi:hypothetical protein GALL_127420 [mine drainage metagenome]|uniref:Uncharacterized protein n=1 Tax=mine drainage metagenome TaxID=410659 RepID=A0A1J5SMD6_9ZZZZ